jgi:hypothetical protein
MCAVLQFQHRADVWVSLLSPLPQGSLSRSLFRTLPRYGESCFDLRATRMNTCSRCFTDQFLHVTKGISSFSWLSNARCTCINMCISDDTPLMDRQSSHNLHPGLHALICVHTHILFGYGHPFSYSRSTFATCSDANIIRYQPFINTTTGVMTLGIKSEERKDVVQVTRWNVTLVDRRVYGFFSSSTHFVTVITYPLSCTKPHAILVNQTCVCDEKYYGDGISCEACPGKQVSEVGSRTVDDCYLEVRWW